MSKLAELHLQSFEMLLVRKEYAQLENMLHMYYLVASTQHQKKTNKQTKNHNNKPTVCLWHKLVNIYSAFFSSLH